jgi:hypothetical protein
MKLNESDKQKMMKALGVGSNFTLRDEANAITAFAFRNSFLEDLHERISQEEMKKLMIESSARLAELLSLKEKDFEKYQDVIKVYNALYCRGWERKKKTYTIKEVKQ